MPSDVQEKDVKKPEDVWFISHIYTLLTLIYIYILLIICCNSKSTRSQLCFWCCSSLYCWNTRSLYNSITSNHPQCIVPDEYLITSIQSLLDAVKPDKWIYLCRWCSSLYFPLLPFTHRTGPHYKIIKYSLSFLFLRLFLIFVMKL